MKINQCWDIVSGHTYTLGFDKEQNVVSVLDYCVCWAMIDISVKALPTAYLITTLFFQLYHRLVLTNHQHNIG